MTELREVFLDKQELMIEDIQDNTILVSDKMVGVSINLKSMKGCFELDSIQVTSHPNAMFKTVEDVEQAAKAFEPIRWINILSGFCAQLMCTGEELARVREDPGKVLEFLDIVDSDEDVQLGDTPRWRVSNKQMTTRADKGGQLKPVTFKTYMIGGQEKKFTVVGNRHTDRWVVVEGSRTFVCSHIGTLMVKIELAKKTFFIRISPGQMLNFSNNFGTRHYHTVSFPIDLSVANAYSFFFPWFTPITIIRWIQYRCCKKASPVNSGSTV